MASFGSSSKWRMWSGDFIDRKSTRLNSSHLVISYAVFCLKKKYRGLCPPTAATTPVPPSSRVGLACPPACRSRPWCPPRCLHLLPAAHDTGFFFFHGTRPRRVPPSPPPRPLRY